MELRRVAGAAFLAGGIGLIATAVVYLDWRAGLAVGSVLLILAGVQVLRSARG